jgi:hypothetical protein
LFFFIKKKRKKSFLNRQSNDGYSQFLNDYPGRFKIEYSSPDDVNDLCFKNNHVHYDTSVTHRPSRYAVSLSFNEKINRFIYFFILSFKLIKNRLHLQQVYQIESNL